MSDVHLRALERRWRESGNVGDEAAWLLARVRAGELSPSRLELAAYCLDPAACRALDRDEPEVPADLPAWGRGLGRWGDVVCVRAAIALARQFAHWWLGRAPRNPAESVLAAERWVLCPSEEHRAATVDASTITPSRAWFADDEMLNAGKANFLAVQAATCARLASVDTPSPAPGEELATALSSALKYANPAELATGIRRGVVPWALGYRDPVRMRVAKRGETEIWPEDLVD